MVKSTQPTFQKEVIILKQQHSQNDCCCYRCIKCECEGNHSDKRICMRNITEYCNSPYCHTLYCSKLDNDDDTCCLIFMTLLFFVPKQATFFPCLFGALLNGCINKYKKTDKNYLC